MSIQQLRNSLIILLKEVHISIIGDFDRRMPQELADDLDLHPGSKKKTGEGMPQGVDAIARQTGIAKNKLERTLEIGCQSRLAAGT